MAATVGEGAGAAVAVVVGASFAGQRVAKLLRGASLPPERAALEVIQIDSKGYFEYYPSTLRCLVEPSHAEATVLPLPEDVIVDKVACVSPAESSGGAGGRLVLASGREVAYDYLVLATGSGYAGSIKCFGRGAGAAEAGSEGEGKGSGDEAADEGQGQDEGSRRAARRRRVFATECKRIEEAREVVVIGGGPVGVEQIAGKFGKDFGKKVILYSKSERLLPGMDARAGAFATEWLKSNGVEIRAGECGPTATTSTTSSEEKGGERVVFTCYGSARNVDFECPLSRSSRGGILVKGTMQSVDDAAVFAVGDCCDVRDADSGGMASEKTAFLADVQAVVAARNILAMAAHGAGAGLETLQDLCHGKASLPLVACISLYKHSGTFQMGNVVMSGRAAAWNKSVIESFQLDLAGNSSGAAVGLKSRTWSLFERLTIFLICKLGF